MGGKPGHTRNGVILTTAPAGIMSSQKDEVAGVSSPQDGEVFCQFCDDWIDHNDAHQIEKCGHYVHRECATHLCNPLGDEWIKPSGQPMLCPVLPDKNEGPKRCDAQLSENDIFSLLGPEVVEQYRERAQQKNDHSIRKCPVCGLLEPHPEFSSSQNKISCSSCKAVFCAIHDAEGFTLTAGEPFISYCQRGAATEQGDSLGFEDCCKLFEESQKDVQLTAKLLAREVDDKLVRHCPNCESPVMKNGGCNAMKCAACQTGFCWLCGEEIQDADGLPFHFMRLNAGMEGDQDALQRLELNCCERTVSIILVFFVMILLMPFMFIACIASCFVNCFMGCCFPVNDANQEAQLQRRNRCLTMVWIVIMLPILLVTALFWAPWYCYLRWKVQRQMAQDAEEASREAIAASEPSQAISASANPEQSYGSVDNAAADGDSHAQPLMATMV